MIGKERPGKVPVLHCKNCNYYKPYMTKNLCPKCGNTNMKVVERYGRRIIDK